MNHDERTYLADYDPGAFERPSVTVDVVMLTQAAGHLWALVVRRDEHPHLGRFALPGGFVRMEEGLEEAAARVLCTKTGLAGVFLEQLYTFGAPDRDPRTRVITVAYYALVDWGRVETARRGDDTHLVRVAVPWAGETGGPVDLRSGDATDSAPLPLAFDHADVLGTAIQRIRGKLDYAPIGFQLLPERFTLRQLQQVHETVLGQALNKDSFRRRMLATGLLEATGERQRDVDHRPAALYRFTRRSAV
jgi:8-oxo-dGTP diphosphatase